MTIRILSFTLAAAWIAAAVPAHAYDPSDPRGPSPDDPSAWGHIGERVAAPVAPAPESSASAVSVRGPDCCCAAMRAGPDARGEETAEQPSRARGDAVETSY